MIIRQRKVEFAHRGRSRTDACDRRTAADQHARTPRISRLMALAIRLDQLIKEGVVSDRAELARLGHVSRARLTQVMNLLQLAPDIQESLLFLSIIHPGRDVISERQLRMVACRRNWQEQRRLWLALLRKIEQ